MSWDCLGDFTISPPRILLLRRLALGIQQACSSCRNPSAPQAVLPQNAAPCSRPVLGFASTKPQRDGESRAEASAARWVWAQRRAVKTNCSAPWVQKLQLVLIWFHLFFRPSVGKAELLLISRKKHGASCESPAVWFREAGPGPCRVSWT